MFRFEDDPLSSLVLLSNDPLPAARCQVYRLMALLVQVQLGFTI